jgi:cytochrome P450
MKQRGATVLPQTVDVSAEQFEVDPYPALAEMREHAPVTFIPDFDAWVVAGYVDNLEVMRAPDRFRAFTPPVVTPTFGGDHHILGLDGERHQRYRRSLNGMLQPRVVDGYAAEMVAPIVDDHLDAISGRGAAEMMASFFEPISVIVLGQALGVPELPADELRRWFHGLTDGATNLAGDAGRLAQAEQVSAEIDEYLLPVMAAKEARPDQTIISHMLAHADGDTFAERAADILPSLKILILGGLQEPGHGAANTVIGLLTHDEQRALFVRDPAGQVEAVVEEGLRWLSPIGVNNRRTVGDQVIGGVEIPADTDVVCSVSSGNRDRGVFGETADAFDFRVERPRHLAFGFGTHFCSGNAFGRVVMRQTVSRLFERLPEIRLDAGRPPVLRGFVFRGPLELHAVW